MTVGERLKEFRLSRGLSQAQLGELLGRSQTFIGLVEHNKRGIGKRGVGLDFAHAVQELTKDWRDERGRKLGPIRTTEWLGDAPAREASR